MCYSPLIRCAVESRPTGRGAVRRIRRAAHLTNWPGGRRQYRSGRSLNNESPSRVPCEYDKLSCGFSIFLLGRLEERIPERTHVGSGHADLSFQFSFAGLTVAGLHPPLGALLNRRGHCVSSCKHKQQAAWAWMCLLRHEHAQHTTVRNSTVNSCT